MTFFVVLVAAVGLSWADPAASASFRMVDRDGVVHLTNAPTHSRYRPLPRWTGTASRWLPVRSRARGQYAREITKAAIRHGVDPELVRSVIRVESGFNPRAVSRKGARGLMQLMPRTASALGVRDVFNPRQNIDGGVRYLRRLIDRYRGNLPLALAAYNAGPRVVDWYGGIPPYRETQDYVRRILALYRDADPSQVIYRYRDADGTIIYTNVPPAFRRR